MLNDISHKLVNFVNSKYPQKFIPIEPKISFEKNFLSILDTFETKYRIIN